MQCFFGIAYYPLIFKDKCPKHEVFSLLPFVSVKLSSNLRRRHHADTKKIKELSVKTIDANKETDVTATELAKLTAMVRKSQRIPLTVLFQDPMQAVRNEINNLANKKSPKSPTILQNRAWELMAEVSAARDEQKQQEQTALAQLKE